MLFRLTRWQDYVDVDEGQSHSQASAVVGSTETSAPAAATRAGGRRHRQQRLETFDAIIVPDPIADDWDKVSAVMGFSYGKGGGVSYLLVTREDSASPAWFRHNSGSWSNRAVYAVIKKIEKMAAGDIKQYEEPVMAQ